VLLCKDNTRLERAQSDGGNKNLPFNRKKPPSEPEPGKTAICLDQLGLRGQERGDNKHHNTRPEIPAEREKHNQMTTIIMSHGE